MNRIGQRIRVYTCIREVAISNLGLIKIVRGSPQPLQIKVRPVHSNIYLLGIHDRLPISHNVTWASISAVEEHR
jgi:hypothetical protein